MLQLKRKSNELRINNYNPTSLKTWRANMDFQFVFDGYACAMDIVLYVSKAQKGMREFFFSSGNSYKQNY